VCAHHPQAAVRSLEQLRASSSRESVAANRRALAAERELRRAQAALAQEQAANVTREQV
jgi:hypothetical protein